jgi:anti-anti-sigma regulatory factor
MPGFEILRIEWSADTGAPIASLHGEVDMEAVETVIGIIRTAELAPKLIVDLAGVTFVDVSGLHLVRTLAAFPNITVQNPSPPIVRLLQTLGIGEL